MPAETACFVKDAEFLAEVTQVSGERETVMRSLIEALSTALS